MSDAALDRPAMKRRVPFSDPTIDALEKQGLFPKRFKLNPAGKRVFWLESEIDAWLKERAASREVA